MPFWCRMMPNDDLIACTERTLHVVQSRNRSVAFNKFLWDSESGSGKPCPQTSQINWRWVERNEVTPYANSIQWQYFTASGAPQALHGAIIGYRGHGAAFPASRCLCLPACLPSLPRRQAASSFASKAASNYCIGAAFRDMLHATVCSHHHRPSLPASLLHSLLRAQL